MTPSISGQFSGDGTAALQHGQAPCAASHGSTQPGWYEWEHGSVVVVASASASAASPRPRTSSRQTAQSTGDGAASGAGALAVSSPARRATRPASGAFFKDTAADDAPGPGWLRASVSVGA